MKAWTDVELQDIMAKANGLFGTLCSLTSTPREAAEIICMIHLMLYMNYGDGGSTIDQMLEAYSKSLKENFEWQKEAHKAVVN